MSDRKHKGPSQAGFDTLALHAGQSPDPTTGARATPIYQSAAFVFPDSDVAVGLFNIERAGHVYSRLSNPTNAVLEERMAALDNGVGAIVTASGQAAMHLAVSTLLSAGDHIVSSRSIYGGTHNLLEYTLTRFGIETTFVDPRSVEAFEKAINNSNKVAMSLSDQFCVDRHKPHFLDLVKNKLDIIFANEVEINSLIDTNDFKEVISFAKKIDKHLIITRGDKGAISIYKNEINEIKAKNNLKIVDLTGAGDLFAAGYLHGFVNNLSIKECLIKATDMSSKVIQQIGARL